MKLEDNPYYNEVKDVLSLLVERGFTLTQVDEEPINTKDSDLGFQTALENILGVDDATLDISKDGHVASINISKDGYVSSIFFCLGNEPGVAICDYAAGRFEDELDEISETIYNKYNEE
jgi:hypothetical protein